MYQQLAFLGSLTRKMAAASQTTDNAIANPTEAESISILHFKCVSYFKYINISAPDVCKQQEQTLYDA